MRRLISPENSHGDGEGKARYLSLAAQERERKAIQREGSLQLIGLIVSELCMPRALKALEKDYLTV